MGKWAVPIAVMAMAAAALALILVNLANEAQPDYADFVPAPDSIIWEKDDEKTLWLSTNRHAVDVRLASIALGIGEFGLRDPASGQVSVLGDGLGCLDAVVSGLTATNNDGSVTLDYTLDRPADGAPLTVYTRSSLAGSDVVKGSFLTSDHTHSAALTESSEGVYTYSASLNEHFPGAITRTVTLDVGDVASVAEDIGEEEFHLLEGTGVTLIACAYHEDVKVTVTLHGDEGVELNRYLVDILPAPTATPRPTPTPVPTPPTIRIDIQNWLTPRPTPPPTTD